MPWDAGHVRAAATWLLVRCYSTYCVAAQPSPSAAAVSQCQLLIEGGPAAGSITTAAMRCTGATADVAVHSKALKQLQAASDRVKLSSSCSGAASQLSSRCLITICGTVVLRDSKVSRVQDPSLLGVVCVVGSSKLEAYNSEMTWNNATALACFGQAQLLLHGSKVAYNYVPQSRGGGVVAYNSSKVVATGRSSIHNKALSGGGLAAWNITTVVISGSSQVFHNVVKRSGGGVTGSNTSRVIVSEGSSVHGNEASLGGGVFVVNNGEVTVSSSSSVYNNTAVGGGGMFAIDKASVTITGSSSIHSNAANRYGGGVLAVGSATVVVTANSSVYQNKAVNGSGGGMQAEGNASVTLAGGSSVYNNTAVAGGGMFAIEKASVTITGSSSVHSNAANIFGGGVLAGGNVTVVVTANSSVYQNKALTGSGGGLQAQSSASVTIAGRSDIHNNTATLSNGGGLAVYHSSGVSITGGSSVRRNVAGQSAGGVYVVGNATVVVTANSNVSHNKAFNGSGGGMQAEGNASVTLAGGSSIHNNMATPFQGGGLAVYDSSGVTITGGSSVYNNTAVSGGGMFAIDKASVSITGSSSVHSNAANIFGGGVLAGGNVTVVVTANSSVYQNKVVNGSGGGMQAEGNASVTLAGGSSIHNNTAVAGGGVLACDKASVTITGSSSIHSNAAMRFAGGGILAIGSVTVVVTANSSVYQNKVVNGSGGGMSAEENASVTIMGGSSIHNNTAVSGGGMFAIHKASVTITGSNVHSNVAKQYGGGVWAIANAIVVVTANSSVYGNKAVNGSGGGLQLNLNATVTITGGSSVFNNTANGVHGTGGGLAVEDTASVAFAGSSCVHGNVAAFGGGVSAIGNSNVSITANCSVSRNTAIWDGGGLFLAENATACVVERSSIHTNACKNGTGGGIVVGVPSAWRLKVARGGRGVEVVIINSTTQSTATIVISNSTVANNTSFGAGGVGGGLAVLTNGTAILIDYTRVIGNTAANSSGGGAVVANNGTLRVEPGVEFADNFVSKGLVGSSIATFGNSTLDMPLRGDLTKCSAGVYLGWDVCREGEILQHGACMCCAPNTVSFSNGSDVSSCRACPANGKCVGSTVVDPIAGYWHSSNRSDQIHRCPMFTESCMSDASGSKCNDGYRGNLCGACQLPKYGMTSPLRCGRCMAPGTQFGLYIMFCFVTVVFITFTVHTTWKDNLDEDQSVRLTDLIKVLVQFLQYVVIIGSVSVPWPPFFNLQRWFQVASVVFGPSSGQSLSLDCWLYHFLPQGALPLAIQRTLVYFLAPLGVLVGVLVLQCVCWVVGGKMGRALWRKLARKTAAAAAPAPFLVWRMLPVTALVLAFYAYPTLLKGALGFFACLRIDRGPVQYWRPGDPGPFNATQGYWTLDIQQRCFAGYHLGWALGLGLPAVLLLCVAVPVAMGLGLHRSRPKADVDSFKEHFGFLYRNYRPECMWWEAVWAAQTVVLTLISVLSFPMERYLSVLGLLLVFLASAALQIFMKPYAMPQLHRMHLVSTACLAATTFGALTVFAYEITATSADVLRLVVTIFVLCINVAFVVWCGFMLLPAAKPILMKLRKLAVKGWALFAPRALEAVRGCRQLPARRNKARGNTV